jgi:hypothetical protein
MVVSYAGQCHCGALQVQYQTGILPASWTLRACQCSFCQIHAMLSTSDPAGSLAFQAVQDSALQRYRFGSQSADFLVCRVCGVYIGAICTGAPGRFGIVNVRTLRPFPEGLPAPTSMRYDDESPGERLARRAARWTPLRADSL